MQIDIRSDIKELTRSLNRIQRKQIPFATVMAVNETARNVRKAEYLAMRQVFTNPTSYTVPPNIDKPKRRGSIFVKNANKKDLSAMVWIKDLSAGKGTPAINYLGPQIFGGMRKPKASEKSLRRKGLIAGNKFITPANVSRNQHGNVTKGTMTKIISGLGALPGAAKGTKSRQKKSYFVMRLGGRGSETGIWERTSKSRINKLFNITNAPSYRPRLPWYQVANRTIQRVFKPNFAIAFNKAIKTAR